MKEDFSPEELHSKGATVQHASPFSELKSYRNQNEITQDFRNKWVIPYYFNLKNSTDDWINRMIQLKSEINETVILNNLGDFNWRTRSTGSYFAAIRQSINLEDIIGTHLLKSEVCRAGSQYAYTLASFNTNKSIEYLNRYLNYYLKKPELYFDQETVLSAIKYLDEINNTSMIDQHVDIYNQFSNWRYDKNISTLEIMKEMIPDKMDELNKEIEENEAPIKVIDTSRFNKNMKTLNKIIEG